MVSSQAYAAFENFKRLSRSWLPAFLNDQVGFECSGLGSFPVVLDCGYTQVRENKRHSKLVGLVV